MLGKVDRCPCNEVDADTQCLINNFIDSQSSPQAKVNMLQTRVHSTPTTIGKFRKAVPKVLFITGHELEFKYSIPGS